MSHANPYPPSFPLPSVTHAISILRGGADTIRNAVNDLGADLWSVQGYLQSVVLGPHSETVSSAANPELGDAKLKAGELLNALGEVNFAELPKGDAGAVGSQLSLFLHYLQDYLVPLLINLISEWLGS